jgi:FkbM family methyltransferase
MKQIRSIMLYVFGFKNYLSIISWLYIRFIAMGLMKKKYPELFYLEKNIKSGFICIDIGANLGYYSYFMAKYTGTTGKVIAVEPVPLFSQIWTKNVKSKFGKITSLLPFALGAENKMVQMGVPVVGGIIHHGMTHILNNNEENVSQMFEVEMRIPDELFYNLSRLDFIKCDVEGYEQFVFGNLKKTIQKFRPLIQCELGGDENRSVVINLLENLNYMTCVLDHDDLKKATLNQKLSYKNDFYFIPQ